jgi:hypothetical protein
MQPYPAISYAEAYDEVANFTTKKWDKSVAEV